MQHALASSPDSHNLVHTVTMEEATAVTPSSQPENVALQRRLTIAPSIPVLTKRTTVQTLHVVVVNIF